MCGLIPYKDIDIREIGLRPGEKMYEELLMQPDALDKTENILIFIERDQPLLRYERDHKLILLQKAMASEDDQAIMQALKDVVPTYREADAANIEVEGAEDVKAAVGGELAG